MTLVSEYDQIYPHILPLEEDDGSNKIINLKSVKKSELVLLKENDRLTKNISILSRMQVYWISGIALCLMVAALGISGYIPIIQKFKYSPNIDMHRESSGRRLQEKQPSKSVSSTSGRSVDSRNPTIRLVIVAASAATYNDDEHEMSVARKQKHDVVHASRTLSNGSNGKRIVQIDSIQYALSQQAQLAFVQQNCEDAFQRMQALFNSNKEHWALSVFQWCAIATATRESSSNHAVLFLDPSSPLVLRTQQHSSFNLLSYLNEYVVPQTDPDLLLPNVAVLGTENNSNLPSKTIHGSFLILRNTSQNHDLAKRILKLVLSTDSTFDALDANALLLPQTLYSLIRKRKEEWYFLEQHCRMQPPRRQPDVLEDKFDKKQRPLMTCASSSGYCCSVRDNHGLIPLTVLLARHPIFPFQVVDPSIVMSPYNRKLTPGQAVVQDDELPFISTISETIIPKPHDYKKAHTFYELLAAKHCLPVDDNCSKCLREKRGASCKSCSPYCHCYCKSLCNPDERPHSRRISKEMIVTPPAYKRDPTRLIPRIVHQTWFEDLTPTKYPNMSRLVQSFVRSGWEYKFYTDDKAAEFLSTHFPKEVREAYDALRPGAFKADLFRYCVLLIHGGVYADVDIQLESALDVAIASDIGFMVPIDEPGKPVHHQMCLWNGFIAAAPGHSFLAKAIETIVNQVRNRFTSVDVDETFCEYHDDRDKIKSPELSVLHAYDTLFTAGPCLLGSSINRVLGRPGQTSFHPGELKGIWDEKHRGKTRQGTSFVIGIPDGVHAEHYNQARVPGRTVILHQNKWDMGAHRFTFVEENLVVAATDLPDSNDLNKEPDENNEGGQTANEDGTKPREHYSKTHAKTGVYGVEHLYTNRNIAYEDIRIYVDASRLAKTFMKSSAVLSSSS